MKKYCIIIGENNEELSRKVQEALFAVGFGWLEEPVYGVGNTNAPILFINCFAPRKIHYRGFGQELMAKHTIDDAVLTTASYVLENAHKLDGAVPVKEPWEVAPVGYRLVTDEEIRTFREPDDVMWCSRGAGCRWIKPCSSMKNWNMVYQNGGYAVPTDYVFEPEVKEMTVAEVSALVGTTVKIVSEYD